MECRFIAYLFAQELKLQSGCLSCYTEHKGNRERNLDPNHCAVLECLNGINPFFIEWAVCKPLIVWHWSVHSATSPSITNSLPTERCLDKEKESSDFFFFVLELHLSCCLIGEGEEQARIGMPQQFCGKTGGAKRSEEEDGLSVWSGVQLYRFSHVRLTELCQGLKLGDKCC